MKLFVIFYKMFFDDLLQYLEEYFFVIQVKNLWLEIVLQYVEVFVQVEGLLGFSEKVDVVLLEKMLKLCVIFIVFVGYDNFDVEVLNVCWVLLMYILIVLIEIVVDMVMVLVLSIVCWVVEVVECVKVGEWMKSIGLDWFGMDVYYKILGIVGMGCIGMVLVQCVYFGFGMLILYNVCCQYLQVEECFNVCYCDFDILLQEVDFVCLILFLSEEIYYLFGQVQFVKMKFFVIFINVGCGLVVDEQVLIVVLQNGEIYVVGFDVFEYELLVKDLLLLSLLNVVVLLYIGFVIYEMCYNMVVCVVDNLIDVLNGNVEKNCVNLQVK